MLTEDLPITASVAASTASKADSSRTTTFNNMVLIEKNRLVPEKRKTGRKKSCEVEIKGLNNTATDEDVK